MSTQPHVSSPPLTDAEVTVRILVRHLPTFLSADALKELFHHYGADSYQYFDSGKMAGGAILSFKSAEKGAAAFMQLSSLVLFGKKLRVEYVRRPKRFDFKKREAFPAIAPELGIDYPSDPTLEYTYPDATPAIVSNISQALLRVPRFYTQVLHLMNKMNLPPPFVTPATYNPHIPIKTKRKQQQTSNAPPPPPPPAAAEAKAPTQRSTADDLSSSESELESDHETQSSKRPRSALSSAEFERQLKAAKAEVIQAAHQTKQQTETLLPPTFSAPSAPPSLHPHQLVQAHHLHPPDAIEDLKQRISIEELCRNFKWTETPPFHKLYVKNLPKDVTQKDLEFIFRRFFASEKETSSRLDIKVMDGKMKGTAFVSFPSVELAQQAMTEMNGVVYRGQPIVLLFGRQ